MLSVTYVDELLQVVVQIRQVFPTLLVLGDELLLPLQQLLALLFEGLALDSLILNTRCHQGILIGFDMLGILGEEFLYEGQWKFLILVAVQFLSDIDPAS